MSPATPVLSRLIRVNVLLEGKPSALLEVRLEVPRGLEQIFIKYFTSYRTKKSYFSES